MAFTAKREHHPALPLYLLTDALLFLAILLGFIALFVPWAQKDVAVGYRAFSYPFKTCYVPTTSPVHQETCMDNDFIAGPKGAPVTAGDATCKTFIITAIALGFCGVFGGFLVFLFLIWVIVRLWYRPIKSAIGAQICIILACICCALCWILFICYAERTCRPYTIFPVKGYSYGFILFIFATALSLASVVTGFMALMKLKNYQLLSLDEQEKDIDMDVQAPQMDIVYPEYSPQGAVPTPVVQYPTYTPVID